MPESQTNIIVGAPSRTPEPQQPSLGPGQFIPQMSGEGYKLIDRLVDPVAIYLDKVTTFFYCGHLIKTSVEDPNSPVPGFRLLKVGYDPDPKLNKWKPNMNLLGYSTVSSEVLMALAEDGSVTRFPDDFQLARFAARQTMSIVGMMISNREEWEFDNYTIIYPFGMTLWKAIVACLSRSRPEQNKRALMDLLVHPNLWFSQTPMEQERPKRSWLNL